MQPLEKTLNSVNEVVEDIASAANQVQEAISAKSDALLTAEQKLMKNCHRYVQDNPFRSLGIAVAAGFVFSRLLSGR